MNCQLERQMELLKDKIQLHNGQSKRENLVVRNLEEMSDVSLPYKYTWINLILDIKQSNLSVSHLEYILNNFRALAKQTRG